MATVSALETRSTDNHREREFVYRPLQQGNIRLVQLYLEGARRIDCRISEVDSLDFTDYWALSYVCGTKPPDYEITVNGRKKRVTATLYYALVAIQELQRTTGTCARVWVDAICIAQHDLPEKSQQVSLMHQIFRRASHVLIWMDDGIQSVNAAHEALYLMQSLAKWDDLSCNNSNNIDLERLHEMHNDSSPITASFRATEAQYSLERLAKSYGLQPSSLQETARLIFDIVTSTESALHGIPLPGARNIRKDHIFRKEKVVPLDHPFWPALFELLHHEWFKRVWTYQEVMLAECSSLLLPDGRLVDWSFLQVCRNALASGAARDIFKDHYQDLERKLQFDLTMGIWNAQYFRSRDSQGYVFKLPQLLAVLCDRRCTDRKDHIYGILGLIDLRARAAIPVDYSASDAVVFAAGMKTALLYGESWLFLLWERHCHTQEALQGLPSWCPDFSTSTGASDGWDHYWDTVSNATVTRFERHAEVEVDGDMFTLGVRGVRADDVCFCTAQKPSKGNFTFNRMISGRDDFLRLADYCFAEPHRTWLLSLDRECRKYGWSSPAWMNAFFSQLKAQDSAGLGTPRTISCVVAFCVLLENFKYEDEISPTTYIDLYEVDFNHVIKITMAMYRLILSLPDDYIIVTRNGKFGTTAKLASPGDVVVYMFGSKLASILSSECDKYKGCAGINGSVEETLLELDEHADLLGEMFYLT